MRKFSFYPILLLCLLLGLTGCAKKETWQLTNIHDLMPKLAFSLENTQGKIVTENDFRGHINLLFFGFASCSDICPITLMKLTQALTKVGKSADSVRILFVTLDPENDSPEILQYYTHTFGSQVVGLRPLNQGDLQTLVKRYRVSYGKDSKNSTISHSGAVYIFDATGTIRLVATQQANSNAIAHDLKQLLNE